MRVADYIMQRLLQVGIRHVFLVTGRGALFLTDALAKNTNLAPVCMHHEQSAAFAAVAYAQQTDGYGACLVSTGCAATNTITGVLSAWQDGVPCIFISGQNTLKQTTRYTGLGIRTYGQQEADIVALVRPITKYVRMITSPSEIVDAMDEALIAAISGRKGPVWIDVPLDLQSAIIECPTPGNLTPPPPRRCGAEDFAYLVDALHAAQRPVLLLGSGVRSAGGVASLERWLDQRPMPVTFTPSAADSYGSGRPLSIGSVGSMACSRSGNFAVQNADLVVVLGSRLNSLTTGPDVCKFARAAKIVVVDIDPIEHSKESVRIDRFIHADARDVLERLCDAPLPGVSQHWLDRCHRWKQTFPAVESSFHCDEQVDLYALADSLSRVLPHNSTLVTDSGLIELILPANVRFRNGLHCIHPASQGCMGFALPAAVGVLSATSHPVVAVVGDGSIMMNLQELETVRHGRLPLKLLIVNNNVYGIIRRRQRDLFRRRTIGTDPANGISCPEFAKVAACFDIPYDRIDSADDLDGRLRDVLEREGPVLCEVMGRPDQDYIEVALTRDRTGRSVRRPLEDQSPFLDRGLFLAEMIVEPIDQ